MGDSVWILAPRELTARLEANAEVKKKKKKVGLSGGVEKNKAGRDRWGAGLAFEYKGS